MILEYWEFWLYRLKAEGFSLLPHLSRCMLIIEAWLWFCIFWTCGALFAVRWPNPLGSNKIHSLALWSFPRLHLSPLQDVIATIWNTTHCTSGAVWPRQTGKHASTSRLRISPQEPCVVIIFLSMACANLKNYQYAALLLWYTNIFLFPCMDLVYSIPPLTLYYYVPPLLYYMNMFLFAYDTLVSRRTLP